MKGNGGKVSLRGSTVQKLVPEIPLNIYKNNLSHRYGPCTSLSGTRYHCNRTHEEVLLGDNSSSISPRGRDQHVPVLTPGQYFTPIHPLWSATTVTSSFTCLCGKFLESKNDS